MITEVPPRSAQAPPSAMARWTLIYDGECSFCRASVELLRRWDRRRKLSFTPFQDSSALAGLPGIPRAELEQAMHLVAPDRSVLRGALTLPAIMRLVPGGTPIALLYHLPGVPRLAASVYRMIARNSHRLGCGSRTCRLG